MYKKTDNYRMNIQYKYAFAFFVRLSREQDCLFDSKCLKMNASRL